MKIVHIAPPWIAIPPRNYGGTEIVIANLIEEQVSQGHDVTLVAPGDATTSARLVSFFPRSLLETQVPWQAHLKAYYHLCKAVEYVQGHSFDLVHTHLSSAADMYLFPLTAHLSTPQVMTLHSPFPFDRMGTWTGDADTLFLEWASQVPMIAISESARAQVPYDLNFVGVVHHGLPMQHFQPVASQPDNYLVWLGRIVPDKGTHLAIQAARAAGVPLVLAGTIDHYFPASLQYFEEMIKPELDGEQVRYIGPVNMQQKIELLSRARGLLNPIQWEEPFGMVMIEAMALGCPVIAFPRGAAPEIVVHRKSGFLAHDVQEMAQYIVRLEQLDRKQVRAHVEQHFSASVMAQKYLTLYRRVISAARRRTSAAALGVKPLLPPPSVLVRTIEPVQVPRQSSLAARAVAEAEPAP
jgi:glycosyltransferase involved in cell wall biosynthesis